MIKDLFVKGGQAPFTLPEVENPILGGIGKITSFVPVYTQNCLKNHDGCYYFSAQGRNEKDHDPYIYKFDPVLNRVVQGFRIRIGLPTTDTHRNATLDIDSSGHLYACCEELYVPPDAHAGPILIYKTTVPYDLSTLTLLSTIEGRWSYPIIAVNGTSVFISARGSTHPTTFVNDELWTMSSTDGGETFAAAVKMYDAAGGGRVAYHARMTSYDGKHHIILLERDNSISNWTFVAHLQADWNSDVWYNAGSTFNKNVSSAGAITRAQIITNYLVLESTDYPNIAVNYDNGVCRSDGTIRMLISIQDLTGVIIEGNQQAELLEMRFYVFSGGSWSYEDVTVTPGLIFIWAYQRPYTYIANDEAFDDIFEIEIDEPEKSINIIRSNDDFATQTPTEILEGNGLYYYGALTWNAEVEEDYLFLLPVTVGNSTEVEGKEGTDDYSDIVILKPN